MDARRNDDYYGKDQVEGWDCGAAMLAALEVMFAVLMMLIIM